MGRRNHSWQDFQISGRKDAGFHEIEVLFENGHDGHTTNYIEVYSENDQELNKIIKVIPTKFENGKLLV